MTPAIKLPLKHPITIGTGEKLTKLSLKRPTRGDLKAADKYSKLESEQEDMLFSRMTGLAIEDLDLLDVADNKALGDTFRDMVGD